MNDILQIEEMWREQIHINVTKQSYSAGWNKFVNNLQNSNRYFVHEDNIETLKSIAEKCAKTIPSKNTVLYRSRLIDHMDMMIIENTDLKSDDTGIKGYSKNDAGPPPKNSQATSGRANPTGIAYLYLADSPETACVEIRPTLYSYISVSKFVLIRDLSIIDLSCHDIAIADNSEFRTYYKTCFAQNASRAFMVPVKLQNDVEYIATQYISAFFKKEGFRGIKYKSAYNQNGYNLVLFNPSDATCEDNFGEVFQPISTRTSFQNISKMMSQKESNTSASISETKPWGSHEVEYFKQLYAWQKQQERQLKRIIG